MTLAAGWLLFPLVLGLLSLGTGLTVQAIAGIRLQAVLLLPVGFATIIVVSLLTTSNGTTAGMTAPAVIALAVAGLALSLPWRRPLVDPWPAVAAGGAFLAVGAPVLLSGRATFAGYITLDDSASWLGFADRLLEHGRNLTGLAPSSFEAMLDFYWNQYGYPVGVVPPLGIGHVLIGTDSAWLLQPYIAFLSAMLALGLYAIASRLVESRPLRALAAVVAAQPALLYGYSQWGGVKELGTSAMLALTVALLPTALAPRAGGRGLVPLAVSVSAVIGILNASSGAWLVPLLLPVLIIGVRRRGRPFVWLAATFVGLVALLSIPSVAIVDKFVGGVGIYEKGGDIGNLIRPLSWLQIFGIWPSGDFRLRPGQMGATYVLIAIVIGTASAGVVWAVRRGDWLLPVLVGGTVVGCAVTVHVGSLWIGAKALAIASPAIVLASMTGVAWLFQLRHWVAGAVLAVAICGGVLWSNALAYHDVWLAPNGQLSELATIGNQFAGDGPTLMTEYQPYGVRHFLDRMDAEGAAELRRRLVLLRAGGEVPKGGYADLDEFQLDQILVYKTLVLLRTPAASRPPASYHLVWSGRFYDVWQQSARPPEILEHFPLGSGAAASAEPRCSEVHRLAQLAAVQGGSLATVIRPRATVIDLPTTSHPARWTTWSGDPAVVYPYGPGKLVAGVKLPAGGRYGIYLGGSFRRQLDVAVDGRHVVTIRHQLNHPGGYTPLGSLSLKAGVHSVTLTYSNANLAPGSGGTPFALGPLILSKSTQELPVTYIDPANASSLCGKSLDWIEAVVR